MTTANDNNEHPSDDRRGPDRGDADDDVLLAELRAVVARVDPVPPDVAAAARAGFIWRTIDAELAQLTSDSVLDADRMASVRGPASTTPDLLTFEAGGLTVEVEATTGPKGLRLLGQLVPAQPGRVEVRHGGGTTLVDVDDMGRFTADGLVSGPVSLRCRTAADGDDVDTDWFLA